MHELTMLLPFFSAFDSDAIHFYAPMRRFFEEIDAAKQGAFAGTTTPDQAHYLTRLYIQADILDDVQPPKIFIQIGDLDDGIHLAISSRQASFNAALDEGEHECHHPIESRSNDQSFQVIEFSASNPCCAPHYFVDKSRGRYQR